MVEVPAGQHPAEAARTSFAGSPGRTEVGGRAPWRADRAWWLGGDAVGEVVGLALLGVLLEVFFVLLAQRFWLTKFFPGRGVSVGFPQMMSGHWATDFRWLAIVLGVPFAIFVPALLQSRALHGPAARVVVFGFAALFGLTLVGMYPIGAADLFHYLGEARILGVYHQNPLIVPPDAHRFVIGITESHSASPYGPVFLLLTQLPIAFTGDHWVASVIGLKLLAFVAYFSAAACIYLTVRRTWPGRELVATLAWAWNPFVVFRAVGNGHNDVLMMAFALASLYFISRRMWRLALPLLALSACVKFTMAVFVPPVVLYAWLVSDARGRRDVLIGVALGVVATIVAYAPFWDGADTFKTFVQYADKTITSVPELITLKLQPGHSLDDTKRLVHIGGYAAFGLAYVALHIGLARRRSFQALIATSVLSLVVFLVFCTWWFRPWYFLWLVAIIPLLPSRWWTAVLVAASLGGTFFDLIEQYRGHFHWLMDTAFRARAGPVFSAFGPLLVMLLLGMAVTGAWTMLRQRDAPDTVLDG